MKILLSHYTLITFVLGIILGCFILRYLIELVFVADEEKHEDGNSAIVYHGITPDFIIALHDWVETGINCVYMVRHLYFGSASNIFNTIEGFAVIFFIFLSVALNDSGLPLFPAYSLFVLSNAESPNIDEARILRLNHILTILLTLWVLAIAIYSNLNVI